MEIFYHEIKSNYKALIGWSAVVLFLQISGYSKFEGFKSTQDNTVSTITNSFPKALQVLFGMYNLNLTTLIGYFGILYLYFIFIATIYSGLLGANIVSKEERDKTSEFLFTKPISRSGVLTSKILAGLVYVLALFLVISVSSVIGVGIVNGGNYSLSSQVMNLMWGLLLLQIFFFSLGILFASIITKPKLSTTLVSIAILASYFSSVATDLTTKLEWLKYFTTYKWFSASNIISNGHVQYSYALIALGFSMLFLVISYIFYNKRDLRT